MGQREILFRGKREHNGEWVYGYLVKFRNYKNEVYTGIIQICDNETQEGGMEDLVAVIPESVGQYIGYTDEKGNKIFEGDILDDRNGLPEYVVVFSSGCFRLPSIKEYEEEDYLYTLPVDEYVLSIMNVVGNVYDDLIKSNK